MKFFKWLKEELTGNVGMFFLAIGVAFFCVVIFNMLVIGG